MRRRARRILSARGAAALWGFIGWGGILGAWGAGAASLPNGNFEKGLEGWQIFVQAGGQAQPSRENPAEGKQCLLLSSAGGAPTWALGPALRGQPGDWLRLSFSARRGPGKALLLFSLALTEAQLASWPLWEGVLPQDAAWHRVSLLLRLPPGAGEQGWRPAFGVAGPTGSWAIDNVEAQPGQAPSMPPVAASGETPQTERLPADWQPEGLLDARAEEVAGQQELHLEVNGLEIILEPEFRCQRGVREGIELYAINRGEIDKTLEVRVAAPEGVDAPRWTVPIRGKNIKDEGGKEWAGTTHFYTGLQSLRRGRFWIRMTFKSGAEERSAPVAVTCEPAYPAFAAQWRESITPEVRAAARQAGLDMHVVLTPPKAEALQPLCAALQGEGDLVLAPLRQGQAVEAYLEALAPLLRLFPAVFWQPAPDDLTAQTCTGLSRLAAILKETASAPAYLITPPIALARDWQKNQLLPIQQAALTEETIDGAASLAVQLPTLSPACIYQQTVDGKADVINGALMALERATDLADMRRWLTARNIRLPLFVGPLAARPTSDERLAALFLARAMTNAVGQGATAVSFEIGENLDNAWALPAAGAGNEEAPIRQVVRLLGQELAAAVPLVPLADSEGISSAPGSPVCYKSFLRGGEGIVVLWNNTNVPKNVTLEFRFEPVVWRRLIFSYQGEFALQRWDPIMQFPAEAFQRRRPVIFMRLDPLQVQVHSFRLLTPHVAWLRKIEFTTPFKPPTAPPLPENEGRSWWQDMLRARSNIAP